MKINIHSFIFIMIALMAVFIDIITYILNFNYTISLVLTFLILAFVSIVFIKKKIIQVKTDFEKSDIFFLIVIGLFAIIYSLGMDLFYDTLNYHVYLQNNFFNDKINFDYFPPCSFFFPLGDRMFYIVRNVLGYKRGIMLSTYTMVVLFYQVKNILSRILKDSSRKKIFLLSLLPVFSFTIAFLIGTYHIDHFSMIILFELISVVILNENIYEDKKLLYYVFLLSGLAIGLKVINAMIVMVVLLLALIKNLKYIKSNKKLIVNIIICFILFILPYMVYIIDNYKQTKNPIFPLYNNIFKSEHYKEFDAMDNLFGAKNNFEKLVWPIVAFAYPNRAADITVIDMIWPIGFIGCIMALFMKNDRKIKEVAYIALASTFLWSFLTNGFVRYVQVIPIMYFIVVICLLANAIKKIKQEEKTVKMLLINLGIIYIFGIGMAISVVEGMINQVHYAYVRGSNYNSSRIIDSEKYDIDGVWGVLNHNSAMPILIRYEDDPIYNLDIECGIDDQRETGFNQKQIEGLYEKLKGKKIYVITDLSGYTETIDLINKKNIYKINYDHIVRYNNYKFQNKNDYWLIIELEYIGS